MNELDLARSLIPQLLSGASPEYGARLKQRLNAELVARGFSTFNEKHYGFKKFSEFLKDSFGALLTLEHPVGAGDIRVSIREAVSPAKSDAHLQHRNSLASERSIVRSDVWQAFANPDETRLRYLAKATREVVHFVSGAGSEFEIRVKSAPEDYVQITPVTGETQQAWMHAFIDQKRLTDNDRQALEALISGKYSSSLNSAFTRALGANGDAWRDFRTGKVTQQIRDWAAEHKIDYSELCSPRNPTAAVGKPLAPVLASGSPKERATHLLALVSDEDIVRIVIPTILSTLLLRNNS